MGSGLVLLQFAFKPAPSSAALHGSSPYYLNCLDTQTIAGLK